MIKKQRSAYIDIIRIVASFFVIIDHTITIILSNEPTSVEWFFSLILWLNGVMAVPLFLMVSGCTLLNKEDEYIAVFKRASRVFCLILFFELIYCINAVFTIPNAGFGIKSLLFQVYLGGIKGPEWYLYQYLAIVLMLPFIQKLAINMKKRDFIYYFIFSIGFVCAISGIYHFGDIEYHMASSFNLFLFNYYLCMLFAGYYINNYLDINKKVFTISIIVFSITIVLEVIFVYFVDVRKYDNYLCYFSDAGNSLNIIASICFFVIIKYIFEKIKLSDSRRNRINNIGILTLGIYLFGSLFIEKNMWIYNNMCKHTSKLISLITMQISVFICSLFVSYILHKIPIINKII